MRFFIEEDDFTRNGYYQIGNVKTFSKFDAAILSQNSGNTIKFIYNDDLMSSYDWTTEPATDICGLYKQRAKQIREKYDYVVIMYSGGIDSQVALDAFLNNNIHVDEICSFSNEFESKDSKFNQEIFKTAIPFVESLDLKNLNTKFRHIEVGSLILNQWADTFHFNNFHHYTWGPQWHVVRSHLFKQSIEDHVILTKDGKTVCYVWGFDKPQISLVEGQYIFKFSDLRIDITPRQFLNRVILEDQFSNFYDEAFYLTPDLPELTIKQCHLLVNRLHSISKFDTTLLTLDQVASGGPYIEHHIADDGKPKYLSKTLVDQIIYPTYTIDEGKNDKVFGSFIFSPRDLWNKGHPLSEKRRDKILKLSSNMSRFFTFKNGEIDMLRAIYSKNYIIGEQLN